MRPQANRHFRASSNASEECRKVLAEYYYLAHLPELSEGQALRIADILGMAESNDILSCLLNEIDEMAFQEMNLTDEDQQLHFQNEAARIQEEILSEHERQILMSLSTSGRLVKARYRSFSSERPRVEMVYDASHTFRESLNRLLQVEYAAENSPHDSFYGTANDLTRRQPSAFSVSRFLYELFVEESVSWMTLAGLICLICVIATL